MRLLVHVAVSWDGLISFSRFMTAPSDPLGRFFQQLKVDHEEMMLVHFHRRWALILNSDSISYGRRPGCQKGLS